MATFLFDLISCLPFILSPRWKGILKVPSAFIPFDGASFIGCVYTESVLSNDTEKLLREKALLFKKSYKNLPKIPFWMS